MQSSEPSPCPPYEALAALARALADADVLVGVRSDPEGVLRAAEVPVDDLPAGVLEAIGSSSPEELLQTAAACATVREFSTTAGMGVNCFF
jgi:hypothetical protein